MKKLISLAVLAFVFLGGLIFLTKENKIQQKTEIKKTKSIKVYEKIVYNNKTQEKEINTKEGTTALEALKNSDFIKINGEGQNSFVTEINGVKADDKKREFWSFYVNGKEAAVGAGSYNLRNEDKVEWKLSTY